MSWKVILGLRSFLKIPLASTDKWFRYTLRPIYDQVVERVADYVGANAVSLNVVTTLKSETVFTERYRVR